MVARNFEFSPSAIEMNAGDTLVFENQDSAPHTLTLTGPEPVDSGTVAPGGRWSTVLTIPGEYSFVCSIHPRMTGTLIVK